MKSDITEPTTGPARWVRSIGPGLVTACVVIGPGSILSSTKVGATHGYALSWVVLVAVLCMMIYMTLGAKLGAITGRSAGEVVSEKAGRPLAVLIGLAVCFISAAYQFGNNLGVHAAFDTYRPMALAAFGGSLGEETINTVFMYVLVPLFNLLAITFLFAFRNLYQALERLMAGFVGLMLLAFVINLAFARPDWGQLLAGFVPRIGSITGESLLELLALVGTTFVITAAYYQSYLVRFKGWGEKEMRNGLIDARVGSLLMALITLMIMSTAAAVFHGTLTTGQIATMQATDVGNQLRPAFGELGRVLFCLGLFSAAYSSFLVNSMIGGFILADGLGLGNRPGDLWPRLLTTAVLITGMGVAMVIIAVDWNPIAAIIAAQAATVLAAPLMAGVLWWLTSRRDLMGEHTNGPAMHVFAACGFVLLLGMAYRLAAVEIPNRLDALKSQPQVSQVKRNPAAVHPGS